MTNQRGARIRATTYAVSPIPAFSLEARTDLELVPDEPPAPARADA